MIHSTDYNDDHDDIASLLGAYAIHATDSKEAKRVEEHLRECPRCRTEVDGFHEIAAAMGNSVEPVSAALWDRIAYGMENAARALRISPMSAIRPSRG